MTLDDVPEVSRVERRCFSNPWPAAAYRRELRNSVQSHYIVLRAGAADLPTPSADGNGHGLSRVLRPLVRRVVPDQPPQGPHVAGFAGMWILYDEAHITTIGTDPVYRGHGLGEVLLIALFEEAVRRGATWITLEVRVSNHVAQRLYQKYGFNYQGIRKRYYSDNGEDAHVMWSRSLREPAYLRQLDELRTASLNRLGDRFDPEPFVSPAPDSEVAR